MATKTYGAETARARLSELLERAHHGTPTIITKRGKAYAILVPAARAIGVRKRGSILTLKKSGAGLWGTNSAANIARMRDEWE